MQSCLPQQACGSYRQLPSGLVCVTPIESQLVHGHDSRMQILDFSILGCDVHLSPSESAVM